MSQGVVEEGEKCTRGEGGRMEQQQEEKAYSYYHYHYFYYYPT